MSKITDVQIHHAPNGAVANVLLTVDFADGSHKECQVAVPSAWTQTRITELRCRAIADGTGKITSALLVATLGDGTKAEHTAALPPSWTA